MRTIHLLQRPALWACTALLVCTCLLNAGCASQNKDALEPKSAAQLLAAGEHQLAKKHEREALQQFDKLAERYPFDLATAQGLLHAVTLNHKLKNFDAGLLAANQFLLVFPRHQKADYVLYMKGMLEYDNVNYIGKTLLPDYALERDLTHFQEAFQAFTALIEQYPKTEYRKAALQKMRYIRDAVARHELKNGHFYYRRKAYIAAANRASRVLTDFQDTSAVVPALALLANSYHKLGADSAVVDVRQVAQHNGIALVFNKRQDNFTAKR